MKQVTKKVFKGKTWIVVVWAIFFWPAAIVYYIMKSEEETTRGKDK